MFQLSALLCQYVLSLFFAKPDNVLGIHLPSPLYQELKLTHIQVIMHLINLLSGFLPYVVYIALTYVISSLEII